jgi:TetR/AcrR family transcriptional repressor for divergent bdcA
VKAKNNPKPRGRPRAFDAGAAVETAMRLFHGRGYDAVGVAELSEALGINPPSLYAAFGSKTGLFRRALERYSVGPGDILARARATGGPVAEVVERMLRLAAQLYPRHDGVAGCLVLDGARNSADPEARALGEAARAASLAALRDFIATEYPAQARPLAEFLGIALAGMSAAARDGAGEAMLTRFAAAAGRAFRREAGAPGAGRARRGRPAKPRRP